MNRVQPLAIVGHHPDEPFARYLIEVLASEGFNGATLRAPSEIRSLPAPDACGVLIVGRVPLGYELQESILAFIRAGGGAVFVRPAIEMAVALGLTARGWYEHGYLWPVRDHVLLPTHLPPKLQFHGGADLYDAPDDLAVAYFGGPDEPGASPAIAAGTLGRGRWAAFAYDLGTSTLLFHEGRQEQSSTGAANFAVHGRGHKPAAFFSGMLDIELRQVPQADLQQRIFTRLTEWVAAPLGPLPRLWYFPDGARAAQFVNGDADWMRREELLTMLEIADRHHAPYATYLMIDDHPKVTPAEVANWRRGGHSFGQHPANPVRPSAAAMAARTSLAAGRADAHPAARGPDARPRPSPAEFAARITWETDQFRRRFGFSPLSTRHHGFFWPGWMDMPRVLERNGVRLDTNFAAGDDYRDGYVAGTGLPFKFMDEDGDFIDVYEQPTITCDDYVLQDKTPLGPLSIEEAIELSRAYLEAADSWAHTVVHQYFHPVYARRGWDHPPTPPWFDATLRSARELRIPALGADQWVRFNDDRRATQLRHAAFDPAEGRLKLEVATPGLVPGLTLSVPALHDGRRATSTTVDGRDEPVRTEDIQGMSYAFVPVPAGAAQVVVSYT